MGPQGFVRGRVGLTLRDNLTLLLGDNVSQARSRGTSHFEHAVLQALSRKGVDGAFTLLAVPVNYDPAIGGLCFNNGSAMPLSYVRGCFQVSVQDHIPNIRQVEPRPNELVARIVIEETIKLYNPRARPLPYR